MRGTWALLAVTLSTFLCVPVATAKDVSRATEFYHIFDFKTDVSKAQMIKAATAGLGRNISASETVTPLVMTPTPEKPQRFEIVNPFENSRMGGLMAMMSPTQLAQLKQAQCNGAIWIANASRQIARSQNLRLTLCIFPYAGGYQLDVYGIDVLDKGGGLSKQLGRAIASAIVGDPVDWTNKTILDIVRSAASGTNAQVSYVEGQPEMEGRPWESQSQLLPNAVEKAPRK